MTGYAHCTDVLSPPLNEPDTINLVVRQKPALKMNRKQEVTLTDHVFVCRNYDSLAEQTRPAWPSGLF